MRIELSWKDTEGQAKSFMTGCPKIAEAMLRSGADFPQVTADMKHAFHERYGAVLGSFEQLLRQEMEKQPLDEVQTQIPGLTLRVRNDRGVESCS